MLTHLYTIALWGRLDSTPEARQFLSNQDNGIILLANAILPTLASDDGSFINGTVRPSLNNLS